MNVDIIFVEANVNGPISTETVCKLRNCMRKTYWKCETIIYLSYSNGS